MVQTDDVAMSALKRPRSTPTPLDNIDNTQRSTPFWNASAAAWSQKLWLPSESNCTASTSNTWTASLKRLASNSWFTVTNSQGLRLPSSSLQQPLWQQITESDKPTLQPPTKKSKKEDPVEMKTKKIRVYPTDETTLRRWFGAARWTYNQCLNGIKKGVVDRNKKSLRAYVINADSDLLHVESMGC